MSLRIHVIFILLLSSITGYAQTPLNFITTQTSVPAPGSTLDVEVRFADFNDLIGVNAYILWDSTVMEIDTIPFVDTSNTLPGFSRASLALPSMNNLNPEQGQMKMFWFSGGAVSIPDSTHLFTMRFNVVGTPCDSTTFTLGNVGSFPTQMTEILNAAGEDIGGIITGPVVEIPGTNCNMMTASPVGFDLLNVTTMSGSNICMPLVVSNFDSIDSFGGSLAWDPNVLSYTGVQAFGVNNFSATDFNELQTSAGSLTYTWIDNSGVNPETLGNGATLFEVCFDVLGSPGSSGQVNIVDTPTPVSITKAQPDPTNPNSILLQFTTSAGIVSVQQIAQPDPVTFHFADVSADMGTNVCIPVTVDDFTNINSVSASLSWDASVAQYTGSQAYALNNFTNNNVNSNNASSGELGFTWSDISSANPATLSNGSTLLELCFDMVGAQGTSTGVNFSNSPFPIMVTQQNSTPGQPAITLQTMLDNGSIAVNNNSLADVVFTLPNLSGNNGDNVCIPVTVDGFTNINSVNGSLMWDPTILSYTGLGNSNLPGLTPSSNLNESQTGNGMLGFSWLDLSGSTPVTIPNGGTLLELCFDVVGSQNAVTTLKMTDSPTIISVSEQPASPSEPSIELSFSLENGSYTVINGPNTGSGVTLTMGSASGSCNDNICVPMTASGFTDINSFNGSIQWSPTELEYTGIANVALPGLTPSGNLNETQTGNGMLGFSWLDLSGSAPVTLASGATIFEVCFDVIGSNSNSTSALTTIDSPTIISISAQPANPSDPSIELMFNLQPGNFTINAGCTPTTGGVDFILSEVCAAPTDNTVCVPLEVNNFTNVSQLDFSLMWDPTVIEFDEVDEVLLAGFNETNNINTNQIDNGMLSFIWFDDTGANPATFADGTAIAEFCFDVIGGNGDVSVVKMFDGQSVGLTDIAVGVAGATPSDPVMPTTYTLDDGEVEIKTASPDFHLSVSETTTETPGGVACVDLNVVNFNNLIITEWNLQFDPNVLCYREIRNINPAVPTMNSGFIDVNTPGIMKLAWSDPNRQGRTIIDGPGEETYFSVCFDVKLPCDQTANVDVLVDPSVAAFFEVVNETNQTTPLPFTFDNGSVTLDCDGNPMPPTITGQNIVNPRCSDENNGAITVDFVGGVGVTNCSWTGPNGFSASFDNCNGTTGISGLAPGTYTIRITDSANNAATEFYSITAPSPIAINATVTNVTCDAQGNTIFGMILVNPSGGTGPYTVSPTQQNLININEGDYRVEVTDSRGCSVVQFYSVGKDCDQFEITSCSATVVSQSECGRGGRIETQVVGGLPPFAVSYSPAVSDINNIPPGAYCLTIRDANGSECKTNTVTVFDSTLPLNAFVSNIQPGNSCTLVGGSADIEVVGGCPPYACSIGLIIGGVQQGANNCSTSNNILPGLYYLRVRDNNNNIFETQFTIPNMPIAPLTSSVSNLEDAGPCSYDNGSVTIGAAGGCGPYTVEIEEENNPGTLVASGAGNVTYQLPTGSYIATITDNDGSNPSMSTETFTIGGPDPITLAGVYEDIDSCDIRIPFAGGTPPYSFEWLDSSNNLVSSDEVLDLTNEMLAICDTASVTRVYTVIVTDGSGCVFNFEESIECMGLLPCGDPGVLSVSDLEGSTVTCPEDTDGTISGVIAQEPAFAPYTITVSDQNGNESSIIQNDVGPFTFPNLSASSYTMMITDINGTDWFLGSNIIVGSNEPIDIELLDSSCEDGQGVLEVSFSGGTGNNYTLEWTYLGQAFSAEPRITDLEEGSYFIEVVDGANCSQSRVYDVMCDEVIEDCDIYDGRPVITPNADGINDVLTIECASADQQLSIYDRWGNMVYSADYGAGWEGLDNDNQRLGEGAYYWVLLVENADGTAERIEKGTVTILRNE